MIYHGTTHTTFSITRGAYIQEAHIARRNFCSNLFLISKDPIHHLLKSDFFTQDVYPFQRQNSEPSPREEKAWQGLRQACEQCALRSFQWACRSAQRIRV